MRGHRRFERLDALANFFRFLEELDDLFPPAKPRSQLSAASTAGH